MSSPSYLYPFSLLIVMERYICLAGSRQHLPILRRMTTWSLEIVPGALGDSPTNATSSGEAIMYYEVRNGRLGHHC